ncbi:MAG: hypothetical protein ABI321_08560 [Polyangia bacterium]
MFTVTIGGLAHRAVVEHVACEHGQLVEVVSEVPHAAREHTVVAASPEHEHHHCALASYRCTSTIVRRAPTLVTAPVVLSISRPVASTHATGASLRDAPKTSPPV